MPITLNKKAYKELIDEDVKFLIKHCPRTLERSHIIEVLNHSVNLRYPEKVLLISKMQQVPLALLKPYDSFYLIDISVYPELSDKDFKGRTVLGPAQNNKIKVVYPDNYRTEYLHNSRLVWIFREPVLNHEPK